MENFVNRSEVTWKVEPIVILISTFNVLSILRFPKMTLLLWTNQEKFVLLFSEHPAFPSLPTNK